ncbi:OmpA family protein [Paracoccus sp. R86501]|uniref:OmpA family protein n=1 Tax=Paracoccus sp. R86501 TaxID=3101711 RepID=UPI00366DE4A9
MRRIIHNTTAIVTCLALLAPQIAAAQDQNQDDLKEGLSAIITQAKEAAQDEDARPAAKGKKRGEDELADAMKAEADRKDAKEGDKKPKAKPGKADKDDAKPKAKPQQKDTKDKKADKEDLGILGEPGKAARDQQDAEKKPAKKPKPDENALTIGTGKVQSDRAAQMPGLVKVLNQEVQDGLTQDQLNCLQGGSYPCADGDRAITPRGVVVEPNGGGPFRLADTSNQMFRVGKSGDMVQRAAEEDTRETQASREAAKQSKPVSAAALNASEGSGKVTEQKVTKDSSRSSSEDFATNLRDALAGSDNAKARSKDDAKDDDSSSDLTKALLLGAGALAVGSFLNNNRQVALSAPDRVVVTREDGSQEVIKDEVALLRQPGSNVTTENFDDGSSRTVVTREDGSRVVTIRDADLRVLRRTLVSADGTTTQLIDDTTDVQPVDVSQLPAPAEVQNGDAPMNEDDLRTALRREADIERRFTLSQIRNIPEVRSLVAPVNIDAITFDSGSAAIRPDQAKQLQSLGRVIQDSVAENPSEIFMIEGHTDTVGADAFNLALSDRRAESVALALTEYFDVPPENLVTQGYGEQFLRIRSEGDIRGNRRASVRRITDLLRTANAQ